MSIFSHFVVKYWNRSTESLEKKWMSNSKSMATMNSDEGGRAKNDDQNAADWAATFTCWAVHAQIITFLVD